MEWHLGGSVFSMLGVLYSGNFYIPCDSRGPLLRTERILKQIGACVIITDTAGCRSLSHMNVENSTITIINIDDASLQHQLTAISEYSFSKNLAAVIDTDPAFVLFTSGSTGDPKGVIISHARIIEYISWAADYFGVTHKDILGNQAPFFFTVSVIDLYLRAKLCIIPENLFSTPSKLVDYMVQHKITQIFWVPTAYAGVSKFEALSEKPVVSLKRALFVGEPMNPEVLNYWLSKQPKTKYYNLYGCTSQQLGLFIYDEPARIYILTA